jgi:hypothetical protein
MGLQMTVNLCGTPLVRDREWLTITDVRLSEERCAGNRYVLDSLKDAKLRSLQ